VGFVFTLEGSKDDAGNGKAIAFSWSNIHN